MRQASKQFFDKAASRSIFACCYLQFGSHKGNSQAPDWRACLLDHPADVLGQVIARLLLMRREFGYCALDCQECDFVINHALSPLMSRPAAISLPNLSRFIANS